MSAIAAAERAKTAIDLGESHFREFKSALDGRPGEKKKRPIKEIATDIAQTLVAFANADGGELLVGVEDNGEITGIPTLSASEWEILD
ncbi:ATP-binding protein, partial [Burkholderia cenocepacia]|nr:ATP-binding protein [Burkholderia cenocepacia]